ncbi:hypothetical protein BDR26DRAFT_853297 [Obelidium mucronatum]|nr:hypothetical protein BDR26DRAFT_853297 [Obelidium mucronatum]
MICCGKCGEWFHYNCVDMTEEKVESLHGEEYHCIQCELEQLEKEGAFDDTDLDLDDESLPVVEIEDEFMFTDGPKEAIVKFAGENGDTRETRNILVKPSSLKRRRDDLLADPAEAQTLRRSERSKNMKK